MKTCIKCGGSWLRDFDPACAHDFGDAPEPEWVTTWYDRVRREVVWAASDWATSLWGPLPQVRLRVEHPTREGAIALWQERWRWGLALAALFRWLHSSPAAARFGPSPLRAVARMYLAKRALERGAIVTTGDVEEPNVQDAIATLSRAENLAAGEAATLTDALRAIASEPGFVAVWKVTAIGPSELRASIEVEGWPARKETDHG